MKSILLLTLIIMLTQCSTESSTNADRKDNRSTAFPSDTLHHSKINLLVKGMYPVVITKDINATRKFFTSWFNFRIVFESTWFILLASPGENSSMIAFMSEDHPSTPPSPKAINGDGMFLTIDVENAAELFNVLQASGASMAYDLKEERWGQRRFAVIDPNGIWIDVVEQIQPEEGWWDEYIK